MDFEDLLLKAKKCNAAAGQIVEMYRPLLIKTSHISGRFDEDLYQELSITLLKCIKFFPVSEP